MVLIYGGRVFGFQATISHSLGPQWACTFSLEIVGGWDCDSESPSLARSRCVSQWDAPSSEQEPPIAIAPFT